MKTKLMGFTLIEVIISLAISVVVIGAIGTFFISNSKMLAASEVRSSLQLEGENIQTKLLEVGQQSTGISELSIWSAVGITPVASNTVLYSVLNNSIPSIPNSVALNQLKVKIFTTDSTQNDALGNPAPFDNYTFTLVGTTLSLERTDGITGTIISTKILSENVESFRITPLDGNSVASPRATTHFSTTKGIEVNIGLHKKKGYSDVTYPVSAIVKFRNMGVVV